MIVQNALSAYWQKGRSYWGYRFKEISLKSILKIWGILSVAAIVTVGCNSAEVVPIADQQSKNPPANTAAGQAVKRFREKRQGAPMGPDTGIKSVN